LPSGIVILLTYLQFRGKERERVGSENPVKVALNHPELWRKLAGTGGCWFLYDFVYYGTALNQTSIINSVFGGEDGIYDNCWRNVVVASMGIPGVVVAILQLEGLGAKRLMSWGFALVGVSSVLLCLSFKYFPDDDWLNFGFFCLLLFAVNWGCNVATYVLPIDTFPSEVRSSFYGLSAALGKVGAFLGGYFFGPISKGGGGYSTVYGVCAGLSLVGIAFSGAYIEPFNRNTLWKGKDEEEDGKRGDDDDDVKEVKRELISSI
jgi:MFS family permease